MPEPVSFQFSAMPYAPEEDDDNPAAYLTRCGWALVEAYGYQFATVGGPSDPNDPESQPVLQLQVTIPDSDAPGGKRAVVLTAPEPIMDVGGDVMSQTAFNAKYGVG